MSPVVIGGRSLGVAVNGVFTTANTDPIPGGRLWPEAALTWNAMRAAAIEAGVEPWEFMPTGPNSSARTIAAQRVFYANQPPPAAVPGTSNHGWGIAVDVKTRRAASWLMANAHRFGWSWDEGRRVGEFWHWRYVGASKATLRRIRKAQDGLAHLTRVERRRVRELDRLRAAGRDPDRRRVLVRELKEQRKIIWRAAKGEPDGWNRKRRRQRYRSLLARTA